MFKAAQVSGLMQVKLRVKAAQARDLRRHRSPEALVVGFKPSHIRDHLRESQIRGRRAERMRVVTQL